MEVKELVMKYVDPLIKKFPDKIKAVWVYGSSARGEAKKTSDIDVMVLLDDVSNKISVSDQQIISAEINKVVETARKDGWFLHFQSPKLLTHWWDLMRSGEPWVLTGMRDSLVIYDPSGFVKPIKRLLSEGRLTPTKERAVELMRRVRERKDKIRKLVVEIILSEILSAMTESAQAVLMYMGKPPVSANRIYSELLKLSNKGYIDKKYAVFYRDFYRLASKMEKSSLSINLEEIEEYMEEARMFISGMEKVFEEFEKEKQEKIITESVEEAMKSVKKIMKKYGIRAEDDKTLIKELKHLVDQGKISQYYLDLLISILETSEKFKKNRKVLSEKEIYNSRLYALTLKDYVEVL